MSREWLVDVKAKCSREGRIPFQFFAELDEHRPAVRQVAEMVLKGGEACDRLAADLERRGTTGDALVSIGQDARIVSRNWVKVRRFGSSSACR